MHATPEMSVRCFLTEFIWTPGSMMPDCFDTYKPPAGLAWALQRCRLHNAAQADCAAAHMLAPDCFAAYLLRGGTS